MGPGDSGQDSRFGSVVRAYRREAGLTQRELAAKAGLSLAALRDLEQFRRQRPRADSLVALASALSLNPAQTDSLYRSAEPPRRRPVSVSSPRLLGENSGFTRPMHPSDPGGGLWLGILGPLEAWGDDEAPLPLGPPARRAVLGLLLMEPGAPVRRDAIIDLLWGDSPPRTAVGLLQAHVSRIRKLLSSHSRFGTNGGTINSVRGAYQVSVSGQEVDLLVFRDLAASAAAARAVGDDVTAVEFYEHAVRLWRGEPLVDVDALSGHPGISALRQELTGVLLHYADVACALGRYHRVLPRLRALAGAEPLNEPAHARLMIALAGSGQQAAALRVYEDVRSRLDRELGIYPSGELAEAYLRVLRQDIVAKSRGRWRSRRPGHPASLNVVPRQLPAGPRFLVGRAHELATLSALLEQGLGQENGVAIAALTGMAGIGKTALAVYWAHQVTGRFSDGQLFVNLRGSDPSGMPTTSAVAVRGFLTALGVHPAHIPTDPDGQTALYRSLVAGRRMLIVLDNAQDAEQVRPLLPGSPGCLVLVTSRNRLTGLAAAQDAYLMNLGVLTDAESHDLMVSSMISERAIADSATISEVIAMCGHLPLALCNVAARVTAGPDLPLTTLLAEMRDERRRLDALETGEPVTSVRKVFSWSRARLGNQTSRVFRLLGVHPGPDITVLAAASLAGLSPRQTYQAFAELCDEHLLTEYVPGRYIFHDLLRSYAMEETRICESETERQDAMRRMLDYYLHAAVLASSFLTGFHHVITWTPSQPAVALEGIGGPGQAAEWFENEQHVLFGVIRQAVEGGYAPYAWQLPWIAGWALRGEKHWQRLAIAQESALLIAKRLNDLAGLAMARQHLGWLRLLLGDFVSASYHLDEAVELARKLGDSRLGGLAYLSRAYALQAQDRIAEAMVEANQALRLYSAAGDPRGEAHALYAIGWHLFQFGDSQQAVKFSSRALMANLRFPWADSRSLVPPVRAVIPAPSFMWSKNAELKGSLSYWPYSVCGWRAFNCGTSTVNSARRDRRSRITLKR
jgi:DNA-binding SARP family transcriptional activator/transcriptional regulator with XRE-family HTH domain/tetratricopeptide (TPR) repeat protein